MVKLHLEFGGIMAATAFVALALSAPAHSDTNMDGDAAAHIAVVDAPAPAATGIDLPANTFRRHADGLFYVEAEANGQSVRFVVDTGATVVVLNRADAAKLGIAYESLQRGGSMRTVGGSSAMRWGMIDQLEMAGKTIEQINAAVVDGALPVSLMGQNALEQLGTVTLRGDTLTIQ